MRPGYGGPPVSVGVSLYVLSVGEISYKFMDFTFDMYFRQFWTDDRLKFDAREVKYKLNINYFRNINYFSPEFINLSLALITSN